MQRPTRPRRTLPPANTKYVIIVVLIALVLMWLLERFSG
jgi:hypothetical protein